MTATATGRCRGFSRRRCRRCATSRIFRTTRLGARLPRRPGRRGESPCRSTSCSRKAAGYCSEGMAVARERVGVASFLQQLAREREDYALPPRLRELAERFIHRSLELLFPHFAAEVGGCAGDVADELAALRTLLTDVLRLPEAHCADPEDVVERFFTALPDIREALLLDAQAIYDGDPAAHSVDEVILAYPGFFATAVYRLAHQLQGCEVPLVPRVLTETAHRDTGIDIHPAARIGASFAIDHGTGIVIGETAVLGARVKLYQGVTLGALSVEKHMA